MATDILKLKKTAVAAGMDRDEARKASRQVLEAFLAKPRKAVKKSSAAPVKKATARKPAATRTPAKRTPAKPAARRSATAKAPAKRTTAKRPATNSNGNGDAGRNLLGTLDFTATDGWNPRVGSAVEVIFKALKKARGDVDKAFDILVPNIAEFVGAKKQDGTKRTKADRENMLRYRISRTKFDFAIKTGQHEIATARVEYGTGPYASTRAKGKPARTTRTRAAAKPAAKPNTRKAPATRGRPRKTAAPRKR